METKHYDQHESFIIKRDEFSNPDIVWSVLLAKLSLPENTDKIIIWTDTIDYTTAD